MKNNVAYLGAWLAAASLAFVLALATPTESSVTGRFPTFISQTLLHQPLTVPAGLPSDRTLALISFKKVHQAATESWIKGLNLRSDRSISWMRIPVINDPGTPTARSAVEDKLLQRYRDETERARLVPLFADRSSFLRSTGLSGTDQAYAMVINREGNVLAWAEGEFDAEKAEMLRETLLQDDF